MVIKSGIIFLIVVLASHASVNGQALTGRNIGDHLLIKESEKTLNRNTDENIVGSPYLTDAFEPGDVYFEKGDRATVPLRYNIYDDWIEYEQKGQVYVLDPSSRIKKVTVNGLVLVAEQYDYKGKLKYGYFNLLDSGKISLLAKQIVIFHERQDAKALESSSTPAKYSRSGDIYYYKNSSGELTKIENLKKFITSLPDKQDEVTAFAKQEKISIRKEDELRKLIQFYNSRL